MRSKSSAIGRAPCTTGVCWWSSFQWLLSPFSGGQPIFTSLFSAFFPLVQASLAEWRNVVWPGALRVHVTGMAISYILLLTAFYVDNGPHLPLWRLLPPLAYWLLPSVVGLPILIWVLTRHPLILQSRIRSKGAT